MDGQTITLLIAVFGLVVATFAVVWGTTHKDRYDMWPLSSWLLLPFGLLIAAFGVLFAVFLPLSASYDESICERYGVVAEREVKFERYGYTSWDCLAETDEGWVSTSRIMKVEESP